MAVNSVSTGLARSHGLGAPNNSQTAKSVAFARRLPDETFARTVGSRVTDVETENVTRITSSTSGDTVDVGPFQDTLEQARREDGASADRAAGADSGSPGSRSSPGIALYQRVSQYGNNEPATSELLKSWNNIVGGGPDGGAAVAAFAKTLSQNSALPFESGVLDLTA